MESVLGIDTFGMTLAASTLFAVMLMLRALVTWPLRVPSRSALVLAALGVILLALLLASYGSRLGDIAALANSRPVTLAALLGVAFVDLAIADFTVSRLVPAAARLAPRRRVSDSAAVVIATIVIVGAFVVADALLVPYVGSQSGATATGPAVIRFDLPGDPMDIALIDDTHGYISLAQGSIIRFAIPDDPTMPLDIQTVATGLAWPHGIAIAHGQLYVAELGPMPCPQPFPVCHGLLVPGATSPGDGDRKILAQSDASILAFPIDQAYGLGQSTVVLSDLPVVNTEHAVNGMTVDPNGDVLVSIGGLDKDWADPGGSLAVAPNPQLLGTVVRLSSGQQPQIFARGLRNVYDLAFDPSGRLWGIDNDGQTLAGWRGEEVDNIVEGGDYGFPDDGTFGRARPRQEPIWLLPTYGTAGVAWYTEPGIGDGLAIGSCGRISFLKIRETASGPTADSNDDEVKFSDLTTVQGCADSLATRSDGSLLAGVFAYGRQAHLLVIGATG